MWRAINPGTASSALSRALSTSTHTRSTRPTTTRLARSAARRRRASARATSSAQPRPRAAGRASAAALPEAPSDINWACRSGVHGLLVQRDGGRHPRLVAHDARGVARAGDVLGQGHVARPKAVDAAILETDLHFTLERDDVLAPRRRVPVDEVSGREGPKLDAGGRLWRAQALDFDVLDVRLAVVARVQAGDLHAPRVLVWIRPPAGTCWLGQIVQRAQEARLGPRLGSLFECVGQSNKGRLAPGWPHEGQPNW